jgi:hypothetical protein
MAGTTACGGLVWSSVDVTVGQASSATAEQASGTLNWRFASMWPPPQSGSSPPDCGGVASGHSVTSAHAPCVSVVVANETGP